MAMVQDLQQSQQSNSSLNNEDSSGGTNPNSASKANVENDVERVL
jgi:hypothetical protein